MIIYVNGDSHAAAAEAAAPYGWAEDDPFYYGLGKRPHPANERVSYGCELANHLNAILDCDAQSGASNSRILRTTRRWMDQITPNDDVLMVIQWSTWEREEWEIDGEFYQVGLSGADSVPESHQAQYKEFIASINWIERRAFWHHAIWNLHREMRDRNIPHLFFNGNQHFDGFLYQQDWHNNYLGPYDSNLTFNTILRENGYKTVNKDSWHFGADAHCFWADFVLNYVHTHKLVP